jgi:hypothetical protein
MSYFVQTQNRVAILFLHQATPMFYEVVGTWKLLTSSKEQHQVSCSLVLLFSPRGMFSYFATHFMMNNDLSFAIFVDVASFGCFPSWI